MGTHSAIVQRDLEGNVTRHENTMNGQLLQDAIKEWGKIIVRDPSFSGLIDPKQIGTGYIESTPEEWECCQEYSAIIDYKNKSISLEGFMIDQELLDLLYNLTHDHGWSLKVDRSLTWLLLTGEYDQA